MKFIWSLMSMHVSLAQTFNGEWHKSGLSGAVCVHAILLPEARVLCLERAHIAPYPPNANTQAAVATEINLMAKVNDDGTWVSSFTPIPILSNPYCGGNAHTASGQVLLIGGDRQSLPQMDGSTIDVEGHFGRRLYTPCNSSECAVGNFFEDTNMSTGRWYPSVVTLYNGNQIIVGGVTGNIDLAKPEGNNPTYEYYPSKEGDWPRVLTILDWSFPYNLYPTVTQLPSGRVFIMSANKTVLLNPVTEEIYADVVPDLIAPDHAPFMYPHTPAYTVLPLTYANNFEFKIQVCGGSVASTAATTKEASKQCWQIAPDSPKPKWVRVDDMPHARVMPDAVLLPDGKVLYVNGASAGTAGGLAGETQYTSDPVFAADLFDPTAPSGKQWTTLASASILHLYHSEAILVQTGHVITTGSEMLNYNDYWNGTDLECYPKGMKVCTDPFNYEIERFSPPYIQKGEKYGRPVIESVPSEFPYNFEFDVTVKGGSDSIHKVVMIRYGAATHSTNMDQRYIELSMLSKGGNKIRVRSPWSSAIAPPGNWMIWAVNSDGIPSESKTVKLVLSFGNDYNFDLKDPNPPSSLNSSKGRWMSNILGLLVLFVAAFAY